MQRHPEHQQRIVKWDFRPEGETSSTRGGWRIYAYRFDLNEPDPFTATAFLCYDKNQAPKKDYVTFLVNELKRFLKQTVVVELLEVRFRHQTLPDGRTLSLCIGCGEKAGESDDPDEIDLLEDTHECTNSLNP
jgi:hypothetical protein